MSNPASPTVYVVDDDDVVRDSLRVLLEVHGYRVKDFESGDHFLAENADLSRSCLIVDVHMPGMTGVDMLGVLRARGETVPAVLITGRRDAHIDTQAAALGGVELLDKPISHNQLFSILQNMLATR